MIENRNLNIHVEFRIYGSILNEVNTNTNGTDTRSWVIIHEVNITNHLDIQKVVLEIYIYVVINEFFNVLIVGWDLKVCLNKRNIIRYNNVWTWINLYGISNFSWDWIQDTYLNYLNLNSCIWECYSNCEVTYVLLPDNIKVINDVILNIKYHLILILPLIFFVVNINKPIVITVLNDDLSVVVFNVFWNNFHVFFTIPVGIINLNVLDKDLMIYDHCITYVHRCDTDLPNWRRELRISLVTTSSIWIINYTNIEDRHLFVDVITVINEEIVYDNLNVLSDVKIENWNLYLRHWYRMVEVVGITLRTLVVCMEYCLPTINTHLINLKPNINQVNTTSPVFNNWKFFIISSFYFLD